MLKSQLKICTLKFVFSIIQGNFLEKNTTTQVGMEELKEIALVRKNTVLQVALK